MEFSQMTQVLCGSGTRTSPGSLDAGLYLEDRIEATINHCNFSHCHAKRGAALFCELTGGTAAFNATWLTVSRNVANSSFETMRDSFPRVSYANFVNNLITANWGCVYANNYGMILTKCFFMGNHNNSGVFDVYRSNREQTDVVFKLDECYFDASLPGGIHATAIGPVYVTTKTALVIQHFENAHCQAEFVYQSSPFTETRDFSLSSGVSSSIAFRATISQLSEFYFATALSALTGSLPESAFLTASGAFSFSSQLLNSAGIEVSSGFDVTSRFELSETRIAQLSALTTASDSDSASGTVTEVSTSLVDYSRPTILFSLSSVAPNSIAFLSSA
jgi:hypothetical protein